MCTKIKFYNEDLARRQAKKLKVLSKKKRIRQKKPGKRLRPYLCQSCNMWHLTSQTKR